MNDKKLLNLDMLEQDVWFNFCYYYQCELDDESIATQNQSYIDKNEKIIKRMKQNDFPVNEDRISFAEMMGDELNIPFKPSQLAELLIQIIQLRADVDILPAKIFQRQYSDILITYAQVLGGLEFIQNNKLARSAKAMLAVKVRYENHLHPRQEIIHRVLREQVAQRGRKWGTTNEAVTSIIPILIKEFEKYDLIWVKSQMNLMQAELQKLEQDGELKSESFSESSIKRKKVSSAVKAKKITKLQAELKKLDSILHAKHPSLKLKDLKYKMPYNNTAYLDETIIHWLRGQPEISEEILDRSEVSVGEFIAGE